MTERENLIKQLDEITDMDYFHATENLPKIADFIIKDRERICEPLVECESKLLKTQFHSTSAYADNICNRDRKNAIDETLKRSIGLLDRKDG